MSCDKHRSKEYWIKLFSFSHDEDELGLPDIEGNIISNTAYFIISQFFKILFMVRTSFIYL